MSGWVNIPCPLLVSPPQTDGHQPLQFSGLANEADVRSELGNVPVLSVLYCTVLYCTELGAGDCNVPVLTDVPCQGSAACGGGGGAR